MDVGAPQRPLRQPRSGRLRFFRGDSMSTVIVFPLVLRAPASRKQKRRRSAELFVFPLSCRGELVKRLVHGLQALPPAKRETYLDDEFGKLCEELAAFGVDCVDCREEAVIALARKIGQRLYGPSFILEDEEQAAQ